MGWKHNKKNQPIQGQGAYFLQSVDVASTYK